MGGAVGEYAIISSDKQDAYALGKLGKLTWTVGGKLTIKP